MRGPWFVPFQIGWRHSYQFPAPAAIFPAGSIKGKRGDGGQRSDKARRGRVPGLVQPAALGRDRARPVRARRARGHRPRHPRRHPADARHDGGQVSHRLDRDGQHPGLHRRPGRGEAAARLRRGGDGGRALGQQLRGDATGDQDLRRHQGQDRVGRRAAERLRLRALSRARGQRAQAQRRLHGDRGRQRPRPARIDEGGHLGGGPALGAERHPGAQARLQRAGRHGRGAQRLSGHHLCGAPLLGARAQARGARLPARGHRGDRFHLRRQSGRDRGAAEESQEPRRAPGREGL